MRSSAWLSGMVLLAALCACEPEAVVPELAPPAPLTDDGRVHLAGDDAATPLFRHLAEHFSARRPGPSVVVEAPLGAAGARRALEDGVLDAALLLVAPGAAEGAGPGQTIAMTRVTLVTGSASALRELSPGALRALWSGTDVGAGATSGLMPLLAAADDPAQRHLATADPALADALLAALHDRRFPTFTDGWALRDAARRTPGALMVTDVGSMRILGLPLWTVRLAPAPGFDDRLAIRLIHGPAPPPRIVELLAFLRSPEGQSLIADVGYGPAPSP